MGLPKIYTVSEHPDREVEQAIHEMSEKQLRVALYGVARGYKFDDAMNTAVFIGTNIKDSWLDKTHEHVYDGLHCIVCGEAVF